MRDVFLFNPTCEMAIANDTVSYMPPAYLQQFESDIAALMGFAGSGNDYLLSTNNVEISGFYDYMGEMGFDLPKVFDLVKIELWENDRIGMLSPWGWSRVAHRILTPLKKFCGEGFINSSVAKWEQFHREFYSRRTSVEFLQKFRERAKILDYILIPYAPV